MDAMDDEQLKEAGLVAAGLMDFADDYRKALHVCPRCGDGPYPETKYPDGDGFVRMPQPES
jgi:hypothetical protein